MNTLSETAKADQARSLRRANERLYSLDDTVQDRIAAKYYRGKKPWEQMFKTDERFNAEHYRDPVPYAVIKNCTRKARRGDTHSYAGQETLFQVF